MEDVPGFLSKVDIFALPSRSEGFGISLIEAMVMGIPCVASRLEGPVEVLQDGKYGALFTADCSEDLAQQLRHIIENYHAKKAAAVDSITYVKQHYNIQTMCDQLEHLMK